MIAKSKFGIKNSEDSVKTLRQAGAGDPHNCQG